MKPQLRAARQVTDCQGLRSMDGDTDEGHGRATHDGHKQVGGRDLDRTVRFERMCAVQRTTICVVI